MADEILVTSSIRDGRTSPSVTPRSVYRIQKNLGQGAYGTVYMGVDDASGEKFAIKRVQRKRLKPDDLIRVEREIIILKTLQHPYIVSIHHVYQTPAHLTIVMDYVPQGELFDYLDTHKPLGSHHVQKLFRQIAAATYFCHLNGVVHRDLKLENIFMDADSNIKIGDFGFANFIPASRSTDALMASTNSDVFDGINNGEISSDNGAECTCSSSAGDVNSKYESRQQHFLKTACGSPLYSSPEIICGKPYRGPEVDVWALGVILYCLNFGIMPFGADNKSMARLKEKIVNGIYWLPEESNAIVDLIKQLLVVDPTYRATMRQVCENEWLNSSYEFLSPKAEYFSSKSLEQQTVDLVHAFQASSAAELLRTRARLLTMSTDGGCSRALDGIITDRDSSPIRTATSFDVQETAQVSQVVKETFSPRFSRATTCRSALSFTPQAGTVSRIAAVGTGFVSRLKPLKFTALRSDGDTMRSSATAVVSAEHCTAAAVPEASPHTQPSSLSCMRRTWVSNLLRQSGANGSTVANSHKLRENARSGRVPDTSFVNNLCGDLSGSGSAVTEGAELYKKPIKIVDLTSSDDKLTPGVWPRSDSATDTLSDRTCGLPSATLACSMEQILQQRLEEELVSRRDAENLPTPKKADDELSVQISTDVACTSGMEHLGLRSATMSCRDDNEVLIAENHAPKNGQLPGPTLISSAQEITENKTTAPVSISIESWQPEQRENIANVVGHLPPAYKIIVKKRTLKSCSAAARSNSGLLIASGEAGTSSQSHKVRSRSAAALRYASSPVPSDALKPCTDQPGRTMPERDSVQKDAANINDDADDVESSDDGDNNNGTVGDDKPPSFRLASAVRNRRVIRDRICRRYSGGGILKWPVGFSDAGGSRASSHAGHVKNSNRINNNIKDFDADTESGDNEDDGGNGGGSSRAGDANRHRIKGILKGGSLSSASHSRTTSPAANSSNSNSAHASRNNIVVEVATANGGGHRSSRFILPSESEADASDSNFLGNGTGIATNSLRKPACGILKKRSKSVGANSAAPRHALFVNGETGALGSVSAVCTRRSSRSGESAADQPLISPVPNLADARFFYEIDDDDDNDDDNAADDDANDEDGEDVSPPLRSILKARERSRSSDSGKVLKSILKKDGSSGHLSTSTSRSMSPFASHSSSTANLMMHMMLDDEDNIIPARNDFYEPDPHANDVDFEPNNNGNLDRTISFSFQNSTESKETHLRNAMPASPRMVNESIPDDACFKTTVRIVPPSVQRVEPVAEASPERQSVERPSHMLPHAADASAVGSSSIAENGSVPACVINPVRGEFSLSASSSSKLLLFGSSGSFSSAKQRPLKSILKNRSESSETSHQSAEHQHIFYNHSRHASFSHGSTNNDIIDRKPEQQQQRRSSNALGYRRASSTPLHSASLTGRPATSAAVFNDRDNNNDADKHHDEYFRKQRQRSCSLDFALLNLPHGRSWRSSPPTLHSSSSSSSGSEDDERSVRRRFKLISILKKNTPVVGCRDRPSASVSGEAGRKNIRTDSVENACFSNDNDNNIDSGDSADVQWVTRLMQQQQELGESSISFDADADTRQVTAAATLIAVSDSDSYGDHENDKSDYKNDATCNRFANLRVDVEPIFRSERSPGGAAVCESSPSNDAELGSDPMPAGNSRLHSDDNKKNSFCSPSSSGAFDNSINNFEFAGHTPRMRPENSDNNESRLANGVSTQSGRNADADNEFFGHEFGTHAPDGIRHHISPPFACNSPLPLDFRSGRRFSDEHNTATSDTENVSNSGLFVENGDDPEFCRRYSGGSRRSGDNRSAEASSSVSPENRIFNNDNRSAPSAVLDDDSACLLRSNLRDSILIARERKISADGINIVGDTNICIVPPIEVNVPLVDSEEHNVVCAVSADAGSTSVAPSGSTSLTRANNRPASLSASQLYRNQIPVRFADVNSSSSSVGENLQQTLLRIAEHAVAARTAFLSPTSAAVVGGNGDAFRAPSGDIVGTILSYDRCNKADEQKM